MWQIHRQVEFTGGENRKGIPTLLAPNQLVNATNCLIGADGTVETRLGKTKVNTDSLGNGGATSIHIYTKASGDNYILIQWTTKLYAAQWNGTALIESFTEIKSGLNAAKLRSVVWKDVIILTNGVDAPFSYNGTACSDLAGSPPDSNLIAVYANRLWLVDAANPNQLRYSDLESYSSWPSLNVILVRDNDGDYITGISPQPGGLVIGKTTSMQTLYGTNRDNFTLTDPFSHTVGPCGFDCMLNAGFIMGRDNWYQFSLGAISPLPETHTALLENATTAQKAAAVGCTNAANNLHLFALGTDIVVIDAASQVITTWTGLNAKSMCDATAEGFPGQLLIGDATIGRVYRLSNTKDDDGTAIQTTIKTGYFDYGTSENKEMRYFTSDVEVITSNNFGSYSYRYDVDFKRLYGALSQTTDVFDYLTWSTDKWDADIWGYDANYIRTNPVFYLHNAKGRLFSHELYSTDRIRFKGYSTKYRVTGRI